MLVVMESTRTCAPPCVSDRGHVAGRLENKVAIVTGGGNGIGRAVCLAFASEGARVAVVDIDADGAADTARAVRERGAEALSLAADVSVRAEVDRSVDATVEAFRGIDVLVNAAIGGGGPRPLLETTEEAFDRKFRTGPLGTLFYMQACHPHMTGRDGAVINFGSSSDMLGAIGYAAYAPAKAAVRTLSKVAAREFGPEGIRVNCIVPVAWTQRLADWEKQDPARAEASRLAIPLQRFGDPELDIARSVVYLASSDASYVTGTTLMVDGGSCLL
jgi:2-hydroxycyclohexanecarboxyl-CoA dehydrogenase